MHEVASYLKFLKNSTNHHGVHSPFVFDLVTKCFYDAAHYHGYELLGKYRTSLLSDQTQIEVTDFGAGSRVFKSNKRQVSKIAKTAGVTATRAKLLFRISHYFKPSQVLELGTSLGLGTLALAAGNTDGNVTSLEGCSETAAVARKRLDDFGARNIRVVIGEFDAFLQNQLSHDYDLIYFDGNHQKDATLRYFEALLPTATNDSVWIFDDIHWSGQMTQAWEAIKAHPSVTVTIDTFQWGFVFFRKEQEKQHFTIRV